MRSFVSIFFSFSCASMATVVLFLAVTATFLSVVALWRAVLPANPWPGPDPGALYLLLILLVPLLGAVRLGRAMYAWLDPVESPPPRVSTGALLGLGGWLVAAVVLGNLLWK